MQKIQLGQSDLHVTPICLGTMTFGEQVDEPTAHAILDRSLERGINFIDTAEMYSVPARAETFGATETIIGNWFAKRPGARSKLVLATKVAGPSRGMPWVREGERHDGGRTSSPPAKASLKRLKTDVIDLYQIHWPERNVPAFGADVLRPDEGALAARPIHEQLEALQQLVQAGKVRAHRPVERDALRRARIRAAGRAARPAAHRHGAERLLPGQPRGWKTAWTKPCTGWAFRCWRIRRWRSAC